MRRRGEVPASPPAGFPIYGLDGSWPGARWLEGFGDAIGEEVRYVRLAYQDPRTGALLLVETCSRSLTDTKAAAAEVDPLRTVAFDAGALLANLTFPAESVPRPQGIRRAIVEHVDQCSGQYAAWPPVTWRVDGAAVTARVWRFADGWAAICDAVDDVYLAAASTGPAELSLGRLRDAHGYGFELDQPLDQWTVGASAAGRQPPEKRLDWHADQLRLVQLPVVATQYHRSASKRCRTSSQERGCVPGSASVAMTDGCASAGLLSSGSSRLLGGRRECAQLIAGDRTPLAVGDR
jgi:hypothetical protein